jgi:DNA polymerase III subunit gamma/tau
MGKALYRRYRSTSFDEVIGQDHITTTLKNALANNAIAHAYLLTGPRGVGKTSIARILAFAVNNLKYDHEVNHLDIIEIDAASNRRIDEIRSLRERVHIAPTSAKYKVYIIDEVHMLTREAFNALLKTLEEPPEHAIFILATTDVHKLPETITSRCVRFTFRPISPDNITNHLANIAKKEKLQIDVEALELLAHHAKGSFRDSISLLEQVKNIGGKIDIETTRQMLGIAPDELIHAIIQNIASGDSAGLQASLQDAYSAGASETTLSKQLSESLQNQLISNTSVLPGEEIVQLLRSLLLVAGSPNPRAELDLALLEIALRHTNETIAAPKSKSATSAPKPQIQESTEPIQPAIDDVSENAVADPKPQVVLTSDESLWSAVLGSLKSRHNTLYGIARMAEAFHIDDTLELRFKFAFHYKQMAEGKNKAVLSKMLQELGHSNILINVVLMDKVPLETSAPIKNDSLSTITNIFGSTEVLES